MAQTHKRHRLHTIARIFAGAIVTTFVILFIASMWLLGPSGQTLVRDLIAGTVSESVGYSLEAKDVELDLPISLAIGELTVADEEGVWLTADNITISVLPSFDLLNAVILPDAKALTIDLKRQPLPPKPIERDGGGGRFDVTIPDLRIGTLILSPELTGLNERLTAAIDGSLNLSSKEAALEFSVVAEIAQGLPVLSAARLDTAGIFQINDNLLFFDSASLGSEAVDVSAAGRLNTKTQRIDIDLSAISENLAALIADADGTLEAEVNIIGAMTSPTLDALITTTDLAFRESALPDSRISISAQPQERDWTGQIELEAGELATGGSPFLWRGETLEFSSFNFADKFGEVAGSISINTSSLLANGNVAIDLPQIEAYQDLLPVAVAGALTGTATLSPSDGKQSAKLAGDLLNVTIAEAQAQSIDITASYTDILTLLPDQLSLSLSGAQWGDAQIEDGTLQANQQGDLWQIQAQARGTAGQPFDLSVAGTADFEDATLGQTTIETLSGTVGGRLVATGAPIEVSNRSGDLAIDVKDLRFGSGRYALNGSRQLDTLKGTLSGENVTLTDLGFDPAPEWNDATGTLSATFNGSVGTPIVDVEFFMAGLRLTGTAANGQAEIAARLSDGQANANVKISEGAAIQSTIAVGLPLTLSLDPFALELADTAPLQGVMDLSLDITTLAKLSLPPEQRLTGRVTGDLTLGGTVAQPSLRGNMNFNNGSLEYSPVGLELQNLAFNLDADGQSIAIQDFRATDPAGNPLSAEGIVTLESIDQFAYNMSINGEQLELLTHPNAIGTLSLDLKAEGNEAEGALSGTLTSQSLSIQLPDQFVETIPELNVVETIEKDGAIQGDKTRPDAYRLALDMVLKADNKVFVRGWGLDAELQGNLAIKGQANDPQVTGKLSTIRGRYEEFGKQLNLTRADIVFEGDMPPSPFLNITGTTSVSNTTINLNITGPLQDPGLGITSSPALPEDEALSLLLFGSGVSNISTLQAVQLANSLRRLSGVGPTGPTALGRIRNTIGVDNLTLKNNGGEASGAALGVGKYIGDNIYLEVEQGLETGSGKAKIEVDVTDNISVESGTSVSGDQNIGINWKRDY